MRQLTLPAFDTRPICPGCHRPADVLGEWSPGSRKYVCRDCCQQLQAGLDAVYDLGSKNSKGIGLRREEEYGELRGLYHQRANAVFELAKGCVYSLSDADADGYLPCMKTDLHLMQSTNGGLGIQRDIDLSQMWWNCKRCRNKLRYLAQKQQEVIHHRARMASRLIVTESMPICQRCGCVHDNRLAYIGGFAAYCQHCDGLNSVEAFYRNKGIFGNCDPEEIFDRIQKSHPDLFTLGILPDYWFELVLKDRKESS